MSNFTPRQVLERQMTIYPLVGAAALVGVWGWWAFLAFVKTPDPKETVSDATIWLIIAAIATVAVPIGLAITLMRTRILLQRGRLTTATVAEIGGAISGDRQSVTFQYIVDGQTFTADSSVATAALNEFMPETTVPVMYDPQKPSRAQVFDHLAGVTVDEPSFMTEVTAGVFDYLLHAALMVGQTLGLMALVHWLAKPYLSAMIGPVIFAALALTLLEARVIELRRGATGPRDSANRRWRDKWTIVLAIIAVAWGLLALNYGRDTTPDRAEIDRREADSARERAERARIERDSREAMEKIRALQEQRKK